MLFLRFNYFRLGERKLLKRAVSGIILTLVVAGALNFALYATILTTPLAFEFVVDQKGGGTFLSIQEGIDSGIVKPGDTLRVWWGSHYVPYAENVNVTIPDLTIKSDVMHNGALKPVIDGRGKGAVFNVTVKGVQIFNFTVQNGKYGISLSSTAVNATLINNLVTNNSQYGIHILSEDNTIKGNILTANNFGISVCSSGNFLRNNNMTDNTYNFGISYFTNNGIDPSNTVNGKPIYIWIDEHYRQVPQDAGYIAVVNSTNIIVNGSNLSNNDYGVRFINVSHSTISNVESYHNFNDGVYLLNAKNIRIEKVNASNNEGDGISMEASNSSQIIGNMVSNNFFYGIYLRNSRDGIIVQNMIQNNYGGLSLWDSTNNTVVENLIQNSGLRGIECVRSSEDKFYHNNIKNNHNQVVLYDSFESWNNPAEGNYWSDYSGVDSNHDGIWDDPYKIDDNNADWHPLVNPWKKIRIFNVAKLGPAGWFGGYNITVQSDHVIASLNFTRIGGEAYPRLLSFNLTAGSSGFCNITIPRAWIDGPFTLSINNDPKNFDQVIQNASHSYLYFTYTAGKFQVRITGTESGSIFGDVTGPTPGVPDGKVDMRDVRAVAKGFGVVLPPNLTPEPVTDDP